MRAIGSMVSILVVAVIGLLVYKFYFTQSQSTGTMTPVQTINVIGVKNDLLVIAQAERNYQAEHGSLASFDELVSDHDLTMQKAGRDGYTYEIEPSEAGFNVTARCSAAVVGCTNYLIDQSMEVRAEP